ncbi:MAG: Jag N-terminal domain-containing protein, partial [Candidatus Eremiobacterota bacterium]
MREVEQTGKTVEEATEKAILELGVTEDEVDIQIIDEGSRGIFGLGA